MPKYEEEIVVNVSSLFGAKTKQPLVRLEIGDKAILLPPAKAQEIGMKMLAGAEAANMDAFIFQWLKKLGVPEEEQVVIVRDYRQFREQTGFEMRFLVDDQGEPKPEV